MTTRVKIRGIYSTALTRLLLDGGYMLAQPSERIRERFGIEDNEFPPDILIRDRSDLQGIKLYGEPEKVCQLLTFCHERLLDVALLELRPVEEDERLVAARIEFPGATKRVLDEIRLSVAPTLVRHHRLRTIDPKALESAEMDFQKHPEKKGSIEERLFLDTILLPLEKSGTVTLEHMRTSGKPMRPREGALVKTDGHHIVFRRSFSQGRYDGLDLPIRPGDYGLTDVGEGAWFVRHAYYTKEGKLVGEYFNINTPVELYPSGARYLDLEVDVIKRAGEAPFLIDQEKLGLLTREGFIGSALEAKAMEVAEGLMHRLQN